MIQAIYNYVRNIWIWLQNTLLPSVQKNTEANVEMKQAMVDLENAVHQFMENFGNTAQSTALSVEQAVTTLKEFSAKLTEINETLKQLRTAGAPQPAVAFIAYLVDEQGNKLSIIEQGDRMDQKVTDPGLSIELVPVDKFGNVGAALDGPVAWSGDSGFVLVDTSADPNGLKAKITYVGPIGDTIVTAKGDGDLGPGVTEITFSLPLHLMPGAAASFQANVTPIAADAGGTQTP